VSRRFVLLDRSEGNLAVGAFVGAPAASAARLRSLHAGCAGMSLRRNLRLSLVSFFGRTVTARGPSGLLVEERRSGNAPRRERRPEHRQRDIRCPAVSYQDDVVLLLVIDALDLQRDRFADEVRQHRQRLRFLLEE
jgi:hypothetical protein